jgi:hypothetical protein
MWRLRDTARKREVNRKTSFKNPGLCIIGYLLCLSGVICGVRVRERREDQRNVMKHVAVKEFGKSGVKEVVDLKSEIYCRA